MAAIFGFSFLFTKTVLKFLAPADLLGFRFALAALALTTLAAAGLVRVDLSRGAGSGCCPWRSSSPSLYFFCETGGIKLTSASEAGAIIGTIPVVVAILAAVVLGERPGFVQSLFILASPLGVALMAAGGGLGGSRLGGMLLLLGAVLSAGIYSILSRHHSKEFTPVEITMVMMWMGAVVFNVVALGGHLAAGSAIPWSAPGPALGLGVPTLPGTALVGRHQPEVQLVHHVRVAEACIGIGEPERAARTWRAEQRAGSSRIRVSGPGRRKPSEN